MRPYELLVFDWDGTLMDSTGEIVSAMQQTIQSLGLPERSPQRMRELIGLGLNDVLARLFPEFDTQRLRRRMDNYRARYGWHRSEAALYPSVRDALQVLEDAGYAMAVATGKSRRGLNQALKSTDTARFFRITRCADESVPKPSPAMLEDIVLRLATCPRATLMIGDTEYDIAMAQSAGVDAIGIGWGVHDATRLRRAGALDVLESIACLPGWLAERERPATLDRQEDPPA